MRSEERKLKYVHNTIAHVSNEDGAYTLNGYGIKTVLWYLIAFVFNNGLIGRRLQFFTDGHKMLNDTILKCFNWCKNIGIILDWYHLEKKCKGHASGAVSTKHLGYYLDEFTFRFNRRQFESTGTAPLLSSGLPDTGRSKLGHRTTPD